MIKSSNGTKYTPEEFSGTRINEQQFNIRNKRHVMKRLDSLITSHEKTETYIQANKRLEKLYEEVKPYFPKEKQSLIPHIDDCFTEILILCEEYFYKHGFYDGKKHVGILGRLLSWFTKA